MRDWLNWGATVNDPTGDLGVTRLEAAMTLFGPPVVTVILVLLIVWWVTRTRRKP